MNLLLLKPETLMDGGRIAEIDGRHFQHLKKILKVSPGQKITIGMMNGKIGQGLVLSMNSQSITLSVSASQDPPPPAAGILIMALPRPLMLKRILQSVTSLGLKDIHLIQTQHVEKSYWNSSDLTGPVIEEQLILGLEQSMDTILPQVTLHRNFSTFSQILLPKLAENRQALLAHPGNHPACPVHVDEPFVLAIGPEGGFTKTETDAFVLNRFRMVQAGSRILRVETAVAVLLGKLLPC